MSISEFKTKFILLLFCVSLLFQLASCTFSKGDKNANEANKVIEEASVKEVTRDKVIAMVRPQLEKEEFQYQSESHSFTRHKNDFMDEVTVQTNNKADFYFHFGRLFPAVAQMVAPYERKKYLNTPDLTVWDSSMNAGPNFPEHYKIEGGWTYSEETEKQVGKEVSEFITEFMLPWLANYPDLKAAREKLSRRPMIKPETTMQILAIDVLLKDKEAFHQELTRAIPVLENSTNHDAVERVEKFTESIYDKYPAFKKN